MSSEAGELFGDWAKAKQEKRAANRANSADYLLERGISFEVRNNGAHLIVKGESGLVDFWPGTGLWIARCNAFRGRGVKNLVRQYLSTKVVDNKPRTGDVICSSSCQAEV